MQELTSFILKFFDESNEKINSLIYEYYSILFDKFYTKFFPNPISEIMQQVIKDLKISPIKKSELKFIHNCLNREESITRKDLSFTKACLNILTEHIIPLLVNVDENFPLDYTKDDSVSCNACKCLSLLAVFDSGHIFLIVQKLTMIGKFDVLQ